MVDGGLSGSEGEIVFEGKKTFARGVVVVVSRFLLHDLRRAGRTSLRLDDLLLLLPKCWHQDSVSSLVS